MPDREFTIADLMPDPENARAHTERNIQTINDSINEVGAARSIVIDERGVVLAGNATLRAAEAAGLRLQVVDSDGRTLIAVRRSGLTNAQKRRLALADNRAAELATWDTTQLMAFDASDLAGLWTPEELEKLLGQFAVADVDAPELANGDRPEFRTMSFLVSEDQAADIQRALELAKRAPGFGQDTPNENSNGNALALICEAYERFARG